MSENISFGEIKFDLTLKKKEKKNLFLLCFQLFTIIKLLPSHVSRQKTNHLLAISSQFGFVQRV